ncbi:MAG TPA: class I SAM-dependent methyltransferase [Tepidisphaeraceae bacterium]|nr:class I SAM-dependent methyltransferase [Tepidisphaeraceae bacterium]
MERFSNLETGQSATMDAPLVLDLITETAAAVTPGAKRVLDIGCGAGNYTLKLLQRLPGLDVTLVDLSMPMLARARKRVAAATPGKVEIIQGDIRDNEIEEGGYDIILAAAVLHHLRGDEEWTKVFGKLHRALRPGGSLWIADLIAHDDPRIQKMMWGRYGTYLENFKGPAYRDQVFAYVQKEDSPRSVEFQVEMMKREGFAQTIVLHKNACFAAFGAMR